MRSMTGFGRAVVERGGARVVAEVRALNQRFFELKMSLPRGWGEHEARVRKMVQDVVSRGRVEIFLRQITVKPLGTQLAVDERLARMYVAEMRRLGRRLHLEGRLGLDTIAHRPEIFHVIEDEGDHAHGIRLGFEALAKALRRLEGERLREGRSIKRDFAARIRKIAAAIPKIRRLADRTRRDVITAFRTRVKDLLENQPVNEKRVYEEAAAAAQRGDISEELTRLTIHLDALGDLVNREGPAGKSIEFLLQEINREVNTMGSKAQSAALSQLTVAIKDEAERMREQAQNVE
jgi:uncharacterized protein (TIGR00255 family)